MRSVLYFWFVLGLIATINASEWKPIIGQGPSLKTVQPLFVDGILNSASSSKSTITFNGQTITTSIGGDVGTNDAAGPGISVDAPDLTSDIEEEPRYLGYSGGKILNGFFAATAPVSMSVNILLKYK